MKKLLLTGFALSMMTDVGLRGADISDANRKLLRATRRGNESEVVSAIEQGANINVQDRYFDGETALIEAVVGGHDAIVAKLIAAGANINMKDAKDRTALDHAKDENYAKARIPRSALDDPKLLARVKIIKDQMVISYDRLEKQLKIIMLLEQAQKPQLDLDLTSLGLEPTPLMHAIATKSHAIITKLIADGIHTNMRDNQGNTALIGAAKMGHKAIAQKLIRAGADLNAQDNRGQTALIGAAMVGESDLVNILIAAGADINVTDKTGRTAFDYAQDEGHEQIAQTLEKLTAPKKKKTKKKWFF